MATEFDEAIGITPTGDGQSAAELGDGWHIGGGINGGITLATIGNAIRHTLADKPDPLAISAHYIAAAVPGPATISTRVLREGRTVATVAADLSQDGAQRIAVLATYGDHARLPADVRTTAVPFELPDREECVSGDLAPEEFRKMAPIVDRFDTLFDPECVGWATGQPSGRGDLRAWLRLKDGREPDVLALLLAVDALPPVAFDLGMMGWAPTLELSVHVRAVPAPGWLRVRTHTSNLAGGMFEEDCEVWDSAGRLVAQSRQLAMTPR
ncbi:thioesterase family protein [Nocardioides houyundeii]|uniref:thioesterase family protein n=1 Tax=Nocardioides houyundeii TaxID=2045452 RepID=UPI000DF2F66E|nr:thioesterase family protein [Nocardioides houyundeii]